MAALPTAFPPLVLLRASQRPAAQRDVALRRRGDRARAPGPCSALTTGVWSAAPAAPQQAGARRSAGASLLALGRAHTRVRAASVHAPDAATTARVPLDPNDTLGAWLALTKTNILAAISPEAKGLSSYLLSRGAFHINSACYGGIMLPWRRRYAHREKGILLDKARTCSFLQASHCMRTEPYLSASGPRTLTPPGLRCSHR